MQGAETTMGKWIALPETLAAFHVKANTKGQRYTETVADLRPVYKVGGIPRRRRRRRRRTKKKKK